MTVFVDNKTPVEIYTKAEIDALFSAQARKRIPVVYNLFGPAHMQATLTQAVGLNWAAIGSCLTCSSLQIPANLRLGKIVYANLRVMWNPVNTNCALRLVKHDNGPTNIEEMAVIYGVNQPPNTVRNDSADVTIAMQSVIDAAQYKNILIQMRDDGTPWFLYAVRLEVTWEV